MAAHDLALHRADESLDDESSEESGKDQFRSLLWAGFRAPATLGKGTLEYSRSPLVMALPRFLL
jgi:hypothetical protein